MVVYQYEQNGWYETNVGNRLHPEEDEESATWSARHGYVDEILHGLLPSFSIYRHVKLQNYAVYWAEGDTMVVVSGLPMFFKLIKETRCLDKHLSGNSKRGP